MEWVVTFVFLSLAEKMPENVSATWYAKFPDKETCERWVEVVLPDPDVKIIQGCTETPK